MAHRATWTNAKSLRQWQDTLTDFCEPIADMAVADIGVDDVLRVLEPRWHEIPTTMSRVRARIEAVLGYAMAKKLRPRGPNPGSVAREPEAPAGLAVEARARRRKRHFPALAYHQVGDLMTKLAAIERSTVALGCASRS